MRYLMKLRTIPSLFCVLAAVAMLPGCFEELLEGSSLGPSCADESEPISLWPPNHDFWTVTPEDCGFSEACGTDHLDVVFLSATSDEPVNGRGDGNTEPDIILDCDSAQLRAERQGPGDGRVYTLHWRATDDARNRTEGQCIVTVPHDQSGRQAGDDGPAYTVEPDEECDTGPATEFIAGDPVVIYDESPFPDCDADLPIPDYQDESWIAVNPADADHMVAMWQTNWGRGFITAVTFDGGVTWESAPVPGLSRCTGLDDFRWGINDPWLTFAANGDVYGVGLNLDNLPAQILRIVVFKSTDGGKTWSDPITVSETELPGFGDDKPSITADPQDPCTVYVTWTRFNDLSVDFSGVALVSRTTDCGETWGEPRLIADGAVFARLALQILVMPDDGSLRAFSVGGPPLAAELWVQQSTDQGDTWSEPVIVDIRRDRPFAADATARIRSGALSFDVAVDRDTGHLYRVWEQLFAPGIIPVQVAFSSSTDGGLTWSTPIRIDQTPVSGSVLLEQAFLPSVEVSDDGTVGVTYYNFENAILGSPGSPTDHWFVHCNPDLADCTNESSWAGSELRLTPESFDYLLAVQFQGRLFLGDYVGLASFRSDFFAFFSVTTDDDPANAVFVPIRGQ